MAAKVCAFTGHRAKKLPWGYDESDPRCRSLKAKLRGVVESLCETGVDRFLCGMANGCDLYFAEIVLALQEHYPQIQLEAAVPYVGQAHHWSETEQLRYRSILSRCEDVTVISEEYTRSCMMHRNRYMVDKCDILLACYDEGSGGTLSTLHMAMEQDKEIILVPIESNAVALGSPVGVADGGAGERRETEGGSTSSKSKNTPSPQSADWGPPPFTS